MKHLLLSLISILMLFTCTSHADNLPSTNIYDIAKSNIIDTPKYKKHILPYSIQWVTNRKRGNITIKSDSLLHNKKIQQIESIVGGAKDLFFNEFRGVPECNKDNLGRLEIRIINKKTLRNKDYFFKAQSTNFGRYFPQYNTLYVIPETLYHPEYLAHELAHYFYDECGITFSSEVEEHRRVYKFEDFYIRVR